MLGSLEEIFSDESELGLALSSEIASSDGEVLTVAMLAAKDRDEQNMSVRDAKLSASHCVMLVTLGNN